MSIKSANQIRKVVRKTELPDNLTLLQRAIYHAAAPVLHEPDVKVYQERARKRLALRFWLKSGATFIALFLALAIFCAYAAWKLGAPDSALSTARTAFIAAIGICSIAMTVIVISASFTEVLAKWECCSWIQYANGREGSIPVEIRHRVKTISRHCRDAEVTVEFLREDPFLIVQHRGERYYVGVWDETGFVG